MKWDDVAKVFRAAKDHFLEKPRRTVWLAHGLVLFFIAHGEDAIAIGQAAIQTIMDKKMDEWTLRLLVGTAWSVSVPLLWLLACFTGAFIVSLLLHRYLIAEIAPGSNYTADRQRFLLEGVEHAGLHRVYKSDPGMPITSQPYADHIRAKLGTAARLRMLTIAGYEYIGKGSDSLLWEGIGKRENLNVEVILLDSSSEGGKAVIAGRIECLSKKDPNFNEDLMREHIAKTIKVLRKLKGQRNHFEIKFVDDHPLFRLLIMDNDMWVSAYEPSAHGHESKVFHFRRNSEGTATWFCAFESLYEQASRRGTTRGHTPAEPTGPADT